MSKRKKAGKLKDKWKEKAWVIVEAPPSFGSTVIASIPITSPEKAIGRCVETTLYDIVRQDPQQYTIKLYFQIEHIDGDRAKTIFKSYEYSRDYLRSLIRRGSSMVNFINDYTTKDGVKIRVYTVFFTQSRINSSRKHALRMIAHNILKEKSEKLNYDQFAQEAVLGKIASDIYNEAKKICQLRHVGIRKMKMVQKPTPMIKVPSVESVSS
ncbi:MAG: 30S ribosomal protein S3ae [Nitrososphaerota archaeon]|nr:30S ribosomal protein S3ae [Nitrososphaerales archaeon]MDW8044612.1 30S ribosomal protein S3ae [Nitrososphaerota archaeon]